MRRALVAAALGCLLVPAAASAKGGVIFDKYPDVQAIGSPMKFTAMLMRGAGTPGKPMQPIEGARPLITFRNSTTGEVVRVRASRSDLNGISYGSVRLPSKGPWTADVAVAGKPIFPGDSEPFRVGVGLTQTIPAADAGRRAQADGANDVAGAGDSTDLWVWLTSAAAVGSALLVFVMRRRGRWGAA